VRRRLVILVSAALVSGPALGVVANSDGRTSSNTDIFMVNADGTGRHNLTKGSALPDNYPALSPSGRILAFSRFEGDGRRGSVAKMPARGGPANELLGGPDINAYAPAWSPDGRLIAFSTCCSQAVGIVRHDGSGLTWIPNASDPAWLGSIRLAFSTDFTNEGPLAIAVAKTDGTERHVVIRGTDVGLRWIGSVSASPNGRTIVFTAIDGPQNFFRVFLLNVAAGSRPRLISTGYVEASWSPTGRHLVLARPARPLMTVRADGTRRRYFPATRRLYPQLPTWSPDGTRLAFIGSPSPSRQDLVVMNVRNRSLRTVARRVDFRRPVWSRNGRRLYYVALSG
jgi:Tol biopolymer transport system component